MSKIIGATVGTPVPQSDWDQTDPNKADYIKNKPDVKIKYIESLDKNNRLNLYELESGVHVLLGEFYFYPNADSWLVFSEEELVSVSKRDDITYIQSYYAKGNEINHYTIYKDETSASGYRCETKITSLSSFVDLATNETVGVVKGTPDGDYGIMISKNGDVQIRRATTADINERKHTSRPIVPANLKQAVTSVFEDVYADVYVKTGKLQSLLKSAMNSLNFTVWDGDVISIGGEEIAVSVDNLENVRGDFQGQILNIRTDKSVFEVYMYVGMDVMLRNVWNKIGELPD